MGEAPISPELAPYISDLPFEFAVGLANSHPMVHSDLRSVLFLFLWAVLAAIVTVGYLALNGGYTFYHNLYYCNINVDASNCDRDNFVAP
mmetsp:Transcript_41810/g.63885  ORF Transcript_41810/g.63885 Transcript_41810/m.63885 type:complete len:90 (-) Transcript_41810:62-331(-)|eukprot:CAMPEP_0170489704 /NCGR_PEP_ID=MMETSP0208-20121228/8009_1 /TAXON_ID=197538 /ORGANISM="Strombidium inclinatum, Strain S3" /LENGTH=89 /DNA_ID=CAMNT_0010764737 /DNA_START=72 /DNA_END=341 /DNA_ORIENTATION=-